MRAPRYPLWAALVALAVGASLLHFRIHPPKSVTYFWPNLFSWLDLVGVSLLFLFRGTAILGLLLNSFLAYLGIIMMADFSIEATMTGFIKVMPWENFGGWLLQTTFPDITILVADFLVGLALYRAILMDARRG
jgi:hypothetical protein